MQRRQSLFPPVLVCVVNNRLKLLALQCLLHDCYKVSVPGDPSTYAQDNMLEACVAVFGNKNVNTNDTAMLTT